MRLQPSNATQYLTLSASHVNPDHMRETPAQIVTSRIQYFISPRQGRDRTLLHTTTTLPRPPKGPTQPTRPARMLPICYCTWDYFSQERNQGSTPDDAEMRRMLETFFEFDGASSYKFANHSAAREQTTVPSQKDDDSEPEIVEVRSTPFKRRSEAISSPAPSNKRAKHGEEEADPQIAQKIAKAGKDFEAACRSCKADARKALKAQYELQISKLKNDAKHKARNLKAKAASTLTETKSKAEKDKKLAKEKHEEQTEDIRSRRDVKIAAMRKSHDAVLKTLQEKYDKEKEKTKTLSRELDDAHSKCKEIEKSKNKEVKEANDDLEAGERKLREEKKQMQRAFREETDLLKPEHSKVVKEKEKSINELAQKVIKLERDFESSQHNLDGTRAQHQALKTKHKDLGLELQESHQNTKKAEKDFRESAKYAKGVDQRTDGKLARAHEKLERAEANLRDQQDRVITLQRENYQLKDTLTTTARLGREKRHEVERLKAELESIKEEHEVNQAMKELFDEINRDTSAQAAPSGDLTSFD